MAYSPGGQQQWHIAPGDNSSGIYPRGTTAVAYIPGGQQQWYISPGDNSSGIYPRGTTAVAYISEYLLIIFHLPYLDKRKYKPIDVLSTSGILRDLGLGFMVFNATFNNISVVTWRSVLLVEETGVPGENRRPAASH